MAITRRRKLGTKLAPKLKKELICTDSKSSNDLQRFTKNPFVRRSSRSRSCQSVGKEDLDLSRYPDTWASEATKKLIEPLTSGLSPNRSDI